MITKKLIPIKKWPQNPCGSKTWFFIASFALCLFAMILPAGAQSYPYWDPYLASPLNCDYFGVEHNGPVAANGSTLFAIRSTVGGSPTRLVRWSPTDGWNEIA